MPDEDICRAAEILEGLINYVTNISVICRQKHANPHDVIIECVKSENVADTMQHLDQLGYNDGPPESAEFGVVDGEEIEIKVEHNLCLEGYKYSSIKIRFYKHIPFDRYSRNLKIVNKGDQGEDDKYHDIQCNPGTTVCAKTRQPSIICSKGKLLNVQHRNYE
jgi:hypothetical protein